MSHSTEIVVTVNMTSIGYLFGSREPAIRYGVQAIGKPLFITGDKAVHMLLNDDKLLPESALAFARSEFQTMLAETDAEYRELLFSGVSVKITHYD